MAGLTRRASRLAGGGLLLLAASLGSSPRATASTCIASGDQTAIQNALSAPAATAVLCQNAVFDLTAPVSFTQNSQQIYTEGLPTDAKRAALRIQGSSQTVAVSAIDKSGAQLRNVIVDGNRPVLGFIAAPTGQAMILFGGVASGQVVDQVKAFEPRSWSTLQVFEGAGLACTGATISNNQIGPSGQEIFTWADGISLSCANSTVSNNTITDTTDGGIVVFGAPGSTISGNTIRAVSRKALGGINMVDYSPWGGNYAGTVVTNNTIDAAGAQIKVALPMGTRVWTCPPFGPANHGGTVTNNHLMGGYMGYGLVADGVTNWTVSGNVSTARHTGAPGPGCSQTVAPPAAFLKEAINSSGSFQPEFQEGYVQRVLLIGPPAPPPVGGVAEKPVPASASAPPRRYAIYLIAAAVALIVGAAGAAGSRKQNRGKRRPP